MSFPDKVNFEIAFCESPAPVVDVWNSLVSFLTATGLLPSKFEVSQIAGHPEHLIARELLSLSPNEVGTLINQRSLNGFHVYAGRHPKTVGYVLASAKESGTQSTLRAQIDHLAESPEDWSGLIDGLMRLCPCIGGWQWHTRYEAWQGNSRIRKGHEERYGPIPPGTRKWTQKSIDGIGPDAEFIDISLNPGRPKHLIPTIYFYPTAEMWLGPHFWQYATCTKEEALAAGFFIEKRDTPHYLYLKCWPEPFTRPDGEQGRMQQRLWKLFFNEDCEWPPGSGTICDEPMYGPPELMPAEAVRKSQPST